MASRGTTFAKQDRDRAKKAKAALKRERREARAEAEENPSPAVVDAGDEIAAADLLRLVEELHQSYADGRMSLDEFDQRKAELMERISVT